MYKLNSSIPNVSSFKVFNNFLAYKDTGSFMDKTLYLNNAEIAKQVTGFQIHNNALYYSNILSETVKLNIESNVKEMLDFDQISEYKLDGNLVFRKNEDLYVFENDSIVYDLNSNFLKFINFLKGNLYYSSTQDKKVLWSYELSTAQTRWQFELKNLGEVLNDKGENINCVVEKFFGIYETLLIVGLNNNQILILNSENGEVIRLLHESPEYYYAQKKLSTLPPSQYFEFDKTNNTLVSLYGNCFFEIDIKNNYLITVTDLKESLAQNGLVNFRRSTGYAFDSEYIYTIGELDKGNIGLAVGDRSVLAYNRATKKIEWNYPFENSSINTDVPKLDSEGKLYILDSKNTLHIFQKT